MLSSELPMLYVKEGERCTYGAMTSVVFVSEMLRVDESNNLACR